MSFLYLQSGGKPNPIDLLQKQLNDKEEALKDGKLLTNFLFEG